MQSDSDRYTVVKLEDPEHQRIIAQYVQAVRPNAKTSLCRFYMRGLCILKKQYCKYAHGIDDLIFPQSPTVDEAELAFKRDQKFKKKEDINAKEFFNQKALMSLAIRNYQNLFDFQVHITHKPPATLEQVNADFERRNRIRSRFHEYMFKQFMDVLLKRYPDSILHLDWVESFFLTVGFSKAQTHCKFSNFLLWVNRAALYVRDQVLLPPMLNNTTSILIPMSQPRPVDIPLLENYKEKQKKIGLVGETGLKVKMTKEQGQQKLIDAYLSNTFPNQKQTICKFFMKGVCFFTEEQCKFCHSIQAYAKNYVERPDKIVNPDHFVQKSLFFQKHKKHITLFRLQHLVQAQSSPEEDKVVYTQKQIDADSALRQRIRKAVHLDLYRQFMQFLEARHPGKPLTTAYVEKEYTNAGFNKTPHNKFPSFVELIREIGYYEEVYLIPPAPKKQKYIFKVTFDEKLDKYYNDKVHSLIKMFVSSKAQTEEERPYSISEAEFRKLFYDNSEPFVLPLHEYLKTKELTFKDFLMTHVNPEQYQDVLVFDFTGKLLKVKVKLLEILQTEPRRWQAYSQLEQRIKLECEASISNNLSAQGLKTYVTQVLVESGARVYFNSVNSQIRVYRPTAKESLEKDFRYCTCKLTPLAKIDQKFEQFSAEELECQKQRIVVVDDAKTLQYAQKILALRQSPVAVDIQGSLRVGGFIDLIQVGIKSPKGNNQILVFDIFKFNGQEELKQLQKRVHSCLARLFEDEKIIKVMHFSRQDSIALHHVFECCLKNVFDTAGAFSFIEQSLEYARAENLTQKGDISCTLEKVLRTSQKAVGLNTVLERFESPNGVNQLKNKMKERFEKAERGYFEKRPLEAEYLEYSVRDVEDLIDVYYNMVKTDPEGPWRQIGKLYSTSGLSGISS